MVSTAAAPAERHPSTAQRPCFMLQLARRREAMTSSQGPICGRDLKAGRHKRCKGFGVLTNGQSGPVVKTLMKRGSTR
jgi:hypothetical protein